MGKGGKKGEEMTGRGSETRGKGRMEEGEWERRGGGGMRKEVEGE